ncbi:MAG: hypothetical protein OXT65_10875 [Alphaproteobacteria bacterium]|nr:hypothetical protein [Alphaproteobacteria bacterium]
MADNIENTQEDIDVDGGAEATSTPTTEEQIAQNAADATEDTAAERRSRRRRGMKVVFYDAADDEMKAQMEEVMKAINEEPNSFDAVTSYGREPIDKLKETADRIIDVQQQFAREVNVFQSRMDEFSQTIKDMDLAGMLGTLKEYSAATAKGLGKGAKGVGKLGAALANMFKGSEKKKTEQEKIIAEMTSSLPNKRAEIKEHIEMLSKVEEGLATVYESAKELGKARVESVRALNVYLGAVPEVKRRYTEEYIPQAQEWFDESGDPEDKQYLDEVNKRYETFCNRALALESAVTESTVAAQELRRAMDTMETQRTTIHNIKDVREAGWIALLAGAGFQASTLKAAEVLHKSDQIGDDLQDKSTKMMQMSHQMTLESQARGTVDPKKLIESINTMQKQLDDEKKSREARLKGIDATSQALTAARNKLIDAVDKAADNSGGRALDSEADSIVTPKAALNKAAEKGSNDNDAPAAAEEKPKTRSARAAAKKKAGGPATP